MNYPLRPSAGPLKEAPLADRLSRIRGGRSPVATRRAIRLLR
jgi:hypothetical protein